MFHLNLIDWLVRLCETWVTLAHQTVTHVPKAAARNRPLGERDDVPCLVKSGRMGSFRCTISTPSATNSHAVRGLPDEEKCTALQRNEMNTFHNWRKCNLPANDAPTSFAISNFPMPVETEDDSIAFEGDDGLVLIPRPNLSNSKD
jgi:hypothetical protein